MSIPLPGGGQTLNDRLTAAKHSIAGSGLAKAVCKATTEEVIGPKRKHLEYLLRCTTEPNVSIPQLANLLVERTQCASWVSVFKALISIHHLMCYGNERFTQYLASSNLSFQRLANFLDKSGVQGYDMSTFIRRYSKYLSEKIYSYRQVAFDFCKVKRGKEDGMMRTMNTDKLLKTMQALQEQIDALLEFDCTPNELTNGVINSCFVLLFKDLIRLFACYNDGIINLLEKFFEMNKKQCKEALDIYKKFLIRMDKVGDFLKVAENVGIDKGEIPDLAKAPNSLLEALEAHLASLEGNKKVASKPTTVAAGVTTFTSNAESTANSIDEREKKRILEEEAERIEALKREKLKKEAAEREAAAAAARASQEQPPEQLQQQPAAPVAVAAPPQLKQQPSLDLLGGVLAVNGTVQQQQQQGATEVAFSNDLLNLDGNPWQNVLQAQQQPPPQSGWGGAAAPPGMQPPQMMAAAGRMPPQPMLRGGGLPPHMAPPRQAVPAVWMNGSAGGAQPTAFQPNFEAAFSGGTAQQTVSAPTQQSSFDHLAPVMQPHGRGAGGAGVAKQAAEPAKSAANQKLINRDVDSSLANLAQNLSVGSPKMKVQQHDWSNPGSQAAAPGGKMGGANWAPAKPMGQQQQPGYSMPMGGSYQQPAPAAAPHMMGQPQLAAGGMMVGGVQPQVAGQQQLQPTQHDPFGAL